MQFNFSAQLWLWQGKGAWYFLTLPKEAADEIKFFNASVKGFTPIAVKVTIGKTSWATSIFPDSKSGSYLLPVKAAVRKAEHIAAGDYVTLTLNVKSDI